MKKDKLRGLDPAEMQTKLREIDEQRFRIKFQMAMGQTEGLRKLREMRKDRARLLTYLRERELEDGGRRRNSMAANKQQTAAHKNEKVGEVVSTKMKKTIVVQVSRRVPHPLYRRIVTKHKKFYAHDEAGRGAGGRRGADRRVPPDEQAEAVASGRNRPALGAGGAAQPADLDVKI